MGNMLVPKDLEGDHAPLTVEQIKKLVPRNMKAAISKNFVQKLNDVAEDPEVRNVFRENMVGFLDVLNEPNINMSAYISAVKYVSYKLMDHTNQSAWCKTFPERHQRMLEEEKGDDAIRAAVSAYSKGKIVNLVMEQALVPTWVLNADVRQKAINRLAHLMVKSKSEKVQADAAMGLLTHLKPPEAQKVDISIGEREDESLVAMRKAITDLAQAKRSEIEGGRATAGEMAASKIIDVEAEVIDG
jgi:uncharacterized protein (UPF0147 family)